MEIYADEATLDLETLKHFSGDFDSLVIPVLCGIGKEVKVERGPFGAVEEGRPTFSLAIPMAPQVLGIDSDLVPVATHKQKAKRSGFCSAMRAGGSYGLQKSKEDGSEHFRGNSEYRKTGIVSNLFDYVLQVLFNGKLPVNKATGRLPVLVRRIKGERTAVVWHGHRDR